MPSGQSNPGSNVSNSNTHGTSPANGTSRGNTQTQHSDTSQVADLPSVYVTSLPSEDRGVDLRPFLNSPGEGTNGSAK